MSTDRKYNWLATPPWVYHSLFWLCYYLYGSLISLTIHQMYDGRFYAELITLMPPDMVLVYINLYLLRPAFLKKQKYALYLLTVFMTMSATSATNIWLHHLYARAGSSFFAASGEFYFPTFASQLLNSIYLLFLTSALKFFKDWLVQQQQLKEKERQQVTLELNFLKAQIHPHFFFNTLNNLYSLTLQKSDLAPEIVLKLSSLMSYMLYESGAATVPLEKEIAILDDYIALEQLRFGNRLDLTFARDGLAKEPIRIPPLLLLTFVENSFKHGIGATIGEGRIDIALRRERDDLVFSISNTVGELADEPLTGPTHLSGTALRIAQSASPASRTLQSDPSISHTLQSATPASRTPQPDLSASRTFQFAPSTSLSGLGLRNTTRRLDLLYGDRYRLDRAASPGAYLVTLKIPLA